jgi:alkanesulfonate monooxygenase SsuD/methylene tetrahydromethanopterin reductase-like flavin-dependent oxidoreductase (luciferase family)
MYKMWHDEDATGRPAAFPAIDERDVRARAVAGTPAHVVDQIRPWVEEFGGRELHAIVRLHYPGMRRDEAERAVRLFAAEVIPPLKQLRDQGDRPAAARA